MLRVGDVARDGDDARELGDGPLERVGVAGVDDEPPAALDERARQREAEPARGAGDDADGHASGLHRRAVAGDDAVVVEPQQRDHVVDVVLALDPRAPKPGLPGKTG